MGRLSKNMPPNGFDLPWDQFKWIPVPSLPLERQWRIAHFLDDQVARIDQAISLRRRQLTLVEEQRLAALDVSIGAGQHAVCSLGLVAKIQTGLALNAGQELKAATLVPYIRVANVKSDHLDLGEVKHVIASYEQIARHALQRGDVLMTEGGDLDKLGRGTVWSGEVPGAIHQNHIFAVRTQAEILLPGYLAYVTQSRYARDYFEQTGSRSTNLASTSASVVAAFKVPLPSLAQQSASIESCRMADYAARRVRFALARSVDLLQERKRALITACVSGEFDVSSAANRAADAVIG